MRFLVEVRTFLQFSHLQPGTSGAERNVHGHTWDVVAEFVGEQLDSLGSLCGHADLQRLLRVAAHELDRSHLNDHPPFDETPPTAELIARYLFESLEAKLGNAKASLSRVSCIDVATGWKISVEG